MQTTPVWDLASFPLPRKWHPARKQFPIVAELEYKKLKGSRDSYSYLKSLRQNGKKCKNINSSKKKQLDAVS